VTWLRPQRPNPTIAALIMKMSLPDFAAGLEM
jgi:hypothetical protein